MTYIYPPPIQDTRETNVDAFGRARVSAPNTLLEYRQAAIGAAGLRITESLSGSTSSNAASAANSAVDLAATGAGTAIRQTIGVATYQPGKSLLVVATAVLDAATNAATTTSRVGLFDGQNGAFFQYVPGTGFSVVVRKAGTDTAVAEGSWNFGGVANPVTTIPDATKAQIFGFDAEWLGVGQVRFFVVESGRARVLHAVDHDGVVTEPYTRNFNVPLRYELASAGGAGTLRTICGTAITEGALTRAAQEFGADRGVSAQAIGNGGTEPLISLRIRTASALKKVLVRLAGISVSSDSSNGAAIRLWYCPPGQGTLTGASWTAANATFSGCEYDVSATSFTTTGCVQVLSEYIGGGDAQISADLSKIEFSLGLNAAETASSVFVVTATNINQNNQDYWAAINWTEYI